MSWTTSPPYSRRSVSPRLPSDSSAPTTPLSIPSPKATPRSLALLNTNTSHVKPRNPISPQKLSKLANALGVSTPTPASMPYPLYSPATSNSTSFGNSSSTPSRYLLHVIPPFHLYFAAQEDSSDSYEQAQFRRGTMIPLHPTLQSQLGAIAREYSLPSTGGMVLYLITPENDAGPRITDDAWRMLWYRALQVDKDGSVAGRSIAKLHSRSTTPSGSPYPSPSTAPDSPYHQLGSPHVNSASLSTTSLDFPTNFNPSAAFPILAKVEFDIDRRKAPWYEHWKHRGRASSHSSLVASSQYSTGVMASGSTKVLQLPLRARSTSPSLAEFKAKYAASASPSGDSEDSEPSGYARLDDSPNGRRRNVHLGQYTTDPLEDVFPSDGATWAQIRNQQGRMDQNSGSPKSPHTPEVAIGGRIGTAILGLDGAPDEEESVYGDDEDVIALWNAKHRPTLDGLPAPPLSASNGLRRSASKHIPPPLDLSTSSKVQIPQVEIAPPTATSPNMRLNSDLPYLDTSSTLELDTDSASLKGTTSAASSRRPSNASEEDRSRRLDELERKIENLSPKLAWQEEKGTQEPTIHVESPEATSLEHGDGPSIAIEDIDKEETPEIDESTISSPLINSLPVPSTKKARRQVSIGSYNAVPGAEELSRALAAGSDSPPLPPLPQEDAKHNGASEEEALRLPSIDLATPVSPGFPISPDPFGRKPIFSDGHQDPESPPAVPAKAENEKSYPVTTPRMSSRFSADSVDSDGGNTPTTLHADRSTSMNFGKGIRNLWRKSGNTKAPIQPLMSPGINGQHTIPNSPASNDPRIPPVPSSAGGYFMPILSPIPQGNSSDNTSASHGRSGSELDPFHFDQESRYPVHKLPSPSQALRDTIPPRAASQASTTPSPSSPPPPPGQKKGILKGWGSKNGGSLKRLSTEFNKSGRSSPQAPAHPPSSFNTSTITKGGRRPSTDTTVEVAEGGTSRHSKQSSKASVSSASSGGKHAHPNNSISGTSHASSHQAPSIQLDTTSSSSSSPTNESPNGQMSPSKSAGAAIPLTPTGTEPRKSISRQWL